MRTWVLENRLRGVISFLAIVALVLAVVVGVQTQRRNQSLDELEVAVVEMQSAVGRLDSLLRDAEASSGEVRESILDNAVQTRLLICALLMGAENENIRVAIAEFCPPPIGEGP